MTKITQKYLKERFDYKDGKLYWKQVNFNPKLNGKEAGCITKEGRIRIHLDGKMYYLHRLIYLYFNKNFKIYDNNIVIDHIDKNTKNNSIENLRLATVRENNCNRSIHKNNKSGYKGITKDKNCWRARVVYMKKTYSKNFTVLEDAIQYTNDMRNSLHKEYASHS